MTKIDFSENDKKWIRALARTHSSYSIQINRMTKQLNAQIEANKNWREATHKYDNIIKMLLKTKRITKEEVSKYLTKKNGKDKNSNNK